MVGFLAALSLAALFNSGSSSGTGTLVAILDTGVDALHPNLAGQLVSGFDFVDNDSDPEDESGHGTRLAGVVAATGSVSGVCETCRVMPIRVVDEEAGVDHDLLADAIDYAVANGADVILIGSGAPGFSPDLATAVADAEAAGVPVVAPAGGGGHGVTLYPAAFPTVLSVVGADANGAVARRANTSGREDVAAPGEGLTLIPFGIQSSAFAGSSIAAAHAAGIMGRVLEAAPALTPLQARQVLRHGTTPLNEPRWTETFDYGVVDLAAALSRADPGLRDVAIQRATPLPTMPLTGQSNVLSLDLVNRGHVTESALTLEVDWDGTALGPIAVGSLAPGASVTVDVPLLQAVVPGTVPVTATLPALPGETFLSDNSVVVDVDYTSTATHDLDLDVGPLSDPLAGAGSLAIPFTVRNRGNQTQADALVEVLVDDVVVDTQAFSLAAGERVGTSSAWALPASPDLATRTLRVRVSMGDPDPDPEPDDWTFTFKVLEPGRPGEPQYADPVEDYTIIMDAPWKTVRDYIPFLYFFPQFNAADATVDSIVLRPYDVTTGSSPGGFILIDTDSGTLDTAPAGTEVVSDAGVVSPGGDALTPGFKVSDWWHTIYRIPTSAVVPAGTGLRYFQARVTWQRDRLWGTSFYTNLKVLRVDVGDATKSFPRFDPADHYYDAHVHTIAEQTRSPDFFAPRKNFGGPLAMLAESTYALSMTDVQLDGNWADFEDELVVTDHSVFYGTGIPAYDAPTSVPDYGPTSGVLPIFEGDWYRTNWGPLAGEEVALASGSNQLGFGSPKNLGHHFLVYDAVHIQGPWHGGDFRGTGTANPNSLLATMGLLRANASGFGYAAHPYLDGFVWPPEYFQQGMGFAPTNSISGPQVHGPVGVATDFILSGLQVWNTKSLEQAKTWLWLGELADVNPFNGGPEDHEFIVDGDWDELLEDSIDNYIDLVRQGLSYSFAEAPNRKLIRKLYQVAGTDAHGDFNYTENSEIASVGKRYAVLESSAYGIARTYVFGADPQDGSTKDLPTAYAEGNSVLTDGPLLKFNLDAHGRHDTRPGADPVWHDADPIWERADGNIGGEGVLDGGRTLLAPSKPGEATEVYISREWLKSTNLGADDLAASADLTVITPGGVDVLAASVPLGSAGAPLESALGRDVDELMAFILSAEDQDASAHLRERCITNPVWAVPVEIDVDAGPCDYDAGEVTVTFDFAMSMFPKPYSVYAQQLDANGDSVGDKYPFVPVGAGWSDAGVFIGVDNDRYTVENAGAIPCPTQFWDAENHMASTTVKSYAVIMEFPEDAFGNVLNSIGSTWVVDDCVGDPALSQVGDGCQQTSGVDPDMSATLPILGEIQAYNVTTGLPLTTLVTFLTFGPALPFPITVLGCDLQVNPSIVLATLIGATDTFGSWSLLLPLPSNPALSGIVFSAQSLALIPTGPAAGGVETTQVLQMTLGCP